MSFQHVQQQLEAALLVHGSALTADPNLLQRVLAPAAIAFPTEVGMVVSAAKLGVPAAIEFAGDAATDLRTKMAEKLARDLNCSHDIADQTVATWIAALNAAPNAKTPSAPANVQGGPPVAPSTPPSSSPPPAAAGPTRSGPPASLGPAPQRSFAGPPMARPGGNRGLTIGLGVAGGVIVLTGIIVAIVLGVKNGGGGARGTTGGFMGGTGGTANQGDVAGNYQVDFDPSGVPAQNLQGMTIDQVKDAYKKATNGSLKIGGDLTFSLTYGDQSGTLQVDGKLMQLGPSYVGQNTSVKSNNQDLDKGAIVVELVPAGGGKLELKGSINDSMQRAVPGMKIYYVK